MELFEYHFNKLDGNLYYNEENDKYEMFSNNGIRKHINYLTFKELFKNICTLELKSPIIVETGIASHGTKSTYLFNEYIRKYGGRLWSVDINNELVANTQRYMCPGSTLVCDDSINFINKWINNNLKSDIIYLDSYDLDIYNPTPSGIHGLNEYKAILPSIKKNTLLLIDDTPITPYWLDTRNKEYEDMCLFYSKNSYMPGKGMFIINENKNANVLLHQYQILYKFND